MSKKPPSTPKNDPQTASGGQDATQSDVDKVNQSKQLAIGASVRVSRLDSLKACRSELGKLYRESRKRAGRFPLPLEAKRLADVLAGVRTSIELEELEKRLQQLEERLAQK
ncbi:MAG: hypothetical protein K0U72_04915 [Gammaproteobacteria bacterium]|nr:hypothetical protein [Gammaproteobacteria bacterium]